MAPLVPLNYNPPLPPTLHPCTDPWQGAAVSGLSAVLVFPALTRAAPRTRSRARPQVAHCPGGDSHLWGDPSPAQCPQPCGISQEEVGPLQRGRGFSPDPHLAGPLHREIPRARPDPGVSHSY